MNEEITEAIGILADYFKAGEELCKRICLEWAEDRLAHEWIESCWLRLPAMAYSAGIDDKQEEMLSAFLSHENFLDVLKTEADRFFGESGGNY